MQDEVISLLLKTCLTPIVKKERRHNAKHPEPSLKTSSITNTTMTLLQQETDIEDDRHYEFRWTTNNFEGFQANSANSVRGYFIIVE